MEKNGGRVLEEETEKNTPKEWRSTPPNNFIRNSTIDSNKN